MAAALLLVLFVREASAWECLTFCGCDWADGSQLTYHIDNSDFSADGIDQIVLGADSWDAGAGRINRGADWDFVRGSDETSPTQGNTKNEVYKISNAGFTLINHADDVAIMLHSHIGCGRKDADIWVNSGETYTAAFPSATTTSYYSIGSVVQHEFGHVLGLDHDDGGSTANLAVMFSRGVGQDMGDAYYRLNEDDYVGLIAGKSDSSTGLNLTLQRFWNNGDVPYESWEDVVDVHEGDWQACPGDTISSGPHAIGAIITGTSAASPLIQWKLSADGACFSGQEYLVGTRTPTISSNETYLVTPNGGYVIPSNTPPGEYYLCAKIDADEVIAETYGSDNIVRSDDAIFEVLSCP